jgi:hypothetical protein
MASFRQRGGKWQARILRTGYPDQTETFETKADAEKWARSVELARFGDAVEALSKCSEDDRGNPYKVMVQMNLTRQSPRLCGIGCNLSKRPDF